MDVELKDLPNKNGSTENDESQLRISILGGTGNYGRALASQFQEAGISFTIGSRQSKKDTEYGASILLYEDAVSSSDVIFLAIPPYAYDNVIGSLTNIFAGKIIVDVSNLDNKDDSSNALRLQSMLPLSYVIKALNTVSAYTLENGSYGASRDTYVCGDVNEGKRKVMQLLREIGLNPIDKGGLRSAVMIEKLPFRFFPGWGTACLITGVTLIPIWFYIYLRFFWYKSEYVEKDKNDLALYYPNRIIAWTMFWVLALTYLPGILAGFIQIFRGTKYTRFPTWLDNWMKCRKQLGLICLFLASIHGCMSCLLMGAGELKHAVKGQAITIPGQQTVVVFQQLTGAKQASFLFATLSLALMSVLGITSLPSVNARMSWLEWDFIQRGLGFTSLIFGFIHVMVYVMSLWDPDYKFGWKSWVTDPKGIYPPGAFVMPMFPLLVIILKVVLMLPGVSCHLNNIRKGKTGYRQNIVKVNTNA